MLAICTRTRDEDYEYRGDVKEYINFKERINKFHFLFDTTKPLIILDGESIFIAGIPTGRKDKVNTVIRYSLFYAGERSRELFYRFRDILKKGNARALADKLDCLLRLNNEQGSLDLKTPDEKTFLQILDTALPKNDQIQASDLAIWTTFCPSERSDQAFESFLLSKRNQLPHHGTIEVDSLTPKSFSELAQKKTPLKARKIILGNLILLCGVGLGIFCASWGELSMKPSLSPDMDQYALRTPAPKMMQNGTGMPIRWRTLHIEPPPIPMEKTVQEKMSQLGLRLSIPTPNAAKAPTLTPVYLPNQPHHPFLKPLRLRQEGPIHLPSREEVIQKETTPPIMPLPAMDLTQTQKTPVATDLPSKKPPRKTRSKEARKK